MIEDQATVAAGDSPDKASRWEDYIDIFFSPAELYRRRARDRVAPPFVTLLLLGIGFYFIMLPANRMAMVAALGDDAQAIEAMQRMGTLFQILGSIFVPITYAVVTISAAVVLMIVGRVLELRTEFSRTLLITTYAAFVYLLAQIASGVSVLLHGEAGLDIIRHVSFGPLRFVGDPEMSRVTIALLRRFELFTLWQVVLWGVGMAVIYRATRAQAAIAAGMTWLLLTLPAVLLAMAGVGAGRGG
jgi:hypothetical protein